MKTETVIKVLRRYASRLQFLEVEAITQNEHKDAERYRFDKNVMNEAANIIESRKE